MWHDSFFVINTLEQPWEERFNEKIGRALFRKNLYTVFANSVGIGTILDND